MYDIYQKSQTIFQDSYTQFVTLTETNEKNDKTVNNISKSIDLFEENK